MVALQSLLGLKPSKDEKLKAVHLTATKTLYPNKLLSPALCCFKAGELACSF